MATADATVGRQSGPAWFRPASVRRVAEMVAGGAIFIVALEVFLGYNLLDPALWSLFAPAFWAGILRTLTYIGLVLPLSVGLGFTLGWVRVSRFRALAWPVSVYVEFFRGVPPLVIVLFASILGPNLFPERFQSAELGLILGAFAIGLHSAAFQGEIFRAGFQSVPRGQLDAAQAIGMRPLQAMRSVVLPQALRLSLPPLSNEFAVLIKDTSLMAIIAGGDLFHVSQLFLDQSVLTGTGELHWLFVVWTAVALVYFVMTFTVTRVMRIIERRYHARGLEEISI